jgi:phosphoribosyl 1,2-cyclic phosphodiesterase
MSAISSSVNAPQQTVTVQSLGSGSSGNAFLITADGNTLLIDCGVGIRTITKALRERQMALADIDAVCVTHEHSDHIRTLPKVIHSELELYATIGTARRSAIPSSQHTQAIEDAPVTVAGITIWPLPVAHDAVEPCGFMAEMPDGSRITMLTDLGCWHESLRDFVRASDLIILEANHDEEMLRYGPYPTYLKRRVASDVGHLSNRHCGLALAETLRGTTHRPEIWLAHLDLPVTALPRTSPGEIWTPPVRNRPVTPFTRPHVHQVEQLGFDLF